MKRFTLLVFLGLFLVVGYSSAQQKVDKKGIAATVKIDQAVSGYLTAQWQIQIGRHGGNL